MALIVEKPIPPGCGLVACTDFDGTIIGEYYVAGLESERAYAISYAVGGLCQRADFRGSIDLYETQAQNDGKFKAITSLYAEQGIDNLIRAPETDELLGMEHILSHWMNLDTCEPTAENCMPARHCQDIAKPHFGVHNEGSNNLGASPCSTRRTHRTQLATSNPTEKIVGIKTIISATR